MTSSNNGSNSFIMWYHVVATPLQTWIDGQQDYMSNLELPCVLYESPSERETSRAPNQERRQFSQRSNRSNNGQSSRGMATGAHVYGNNIRGPHSQTSFHETTTPSVSGSTSRGAQIQTYVQPTSAHSLHHYASMVEYKCTMTLGKTCIELKIPQPLYKARSTLNIEGSDYSAFRATLRSPLIGHPQYCVGSYAPDEDFAREDVARKLLRRVLSAL
ncbi:hypothetical protein SESBI_47363 [Sesbania bispinosa]|nr:hypothetical protein SESBI_47363 [Sesbania bispinosa]